MPDLDEIHDFLLSAIAEHGLPSVLRVMARVMAGAVTGEIIVQVAAVESWLAALQRQNDNEPPEGGPEVA
jgi:hypothetical protein